MTVAPKKPRQPAATPQLLGQRWAQAVVGSSFVGCETRELVGFFQGLVERLVALLAAQQEPDPREAEQIGGEMVAAHCTDAATLAATLHVLVDEIPKMPAVPAVTPQRLATVVGAVAAGFAAALRDRTLDEQEEIRRAVTDAYRLSQQRAAAVETRFQTVFTEAAVGIGIGDLAGNIQEVNPALMTMFGYTAEEFTRRNVAEMIHPDDAPDIWRAYDELVSGRRDHFRVEKRFFRADGEVIWTNLSVSLVRDETGAPAYQVAMLQDITEQQQLRRSLEHMAYHDQLTGLPNRARLIQRLAELFTAAPADRRVALCYLDLDGFKTVNDDFGHDYGDQLLTTIAHRLARCCGPRDLAARMGGDEFVVLIPDVSGIGEVIDCAARILSELAAPIGLDAGQATVTTSIGVVEQAVADTTPAQLVAAADQALLWAKADGKARYAVFDRQRRCREITAFTSWGRGR